MRRYLPCRNGGRQAADPATVENGRVAERTKATVLKTVSGATRSWVRIPVLPLSTSGFTTSGSQAADDGVAMGPHWSHIRRDSGGEGVSSARRCVVSEGRQT